MAKIKKSKELSQTARLLEVVGDLRAKCPWDKKQTHQSLSRYLLEESYEAIDAIATKKDGPLREELGDVLLQVALHAEIANERKAFNFEDVAKSIADKMIARHPHVYGQAEILDAESQLKNWTKLKEKERPDRSLLGGIPRALPGLQRCQRYGEIAASVGFDWKDAAAVMEKTREELGELTVELNRKKKSNSAIAEELGDLLFSLTQLARHLGLDSEAVARKSADKFASRFSYLEKKFKSQKRALSDCSLEELEAAWEEAKRKK